MVWLASLLLQALLSPSAQCKRDGTWKEIEARELVPGDLIQLKGGDVIPADAKVQFLVMLQARSHLTLYTTHTLSKLHPNPAYGPFGGSIFGKQDRSHIKVIL